MKKYLPLLIFFCVVPLSAAELEYPEIIKNGTILINAGVGFGNLGKGEPAPLQLCPPLTVSVDYALPIMGLPFTLGLITGYFSDRAKSNYMPIAARIGYHLPIYVRRLDTYMLLTLGGLVRERKSNNFWMGVSAGARYFFLPNNHHIGAYAELGIDRVQFITFGVAFNL